MSIPTDPHDKLVRKSMQNKQVAKAFFERHLPDSVRSVLDTDSLKLEESSYIDNKLQKTASDLVFSCCYKQLTHSRSAKLVLLVEHQSKPQKLLPFRVYHYMFNMLYRTLKQRSKKQANEKIPAVYALVFYHGKQTPYPYSLSLFDCFDDPHNIMKDLFTGSIPLLDVNQEPDEQLKKLKLLGILSLALKYSRNKDALTFMMMLSEILNIMDISEPETIDLLKTVFTYILVVSKTKDTEAFIEQSWRLPKPLRGELMTIAEQLEARGETKGREKALIEVATNFLKDGAEPKFVAKNTQLDLAKVMALKADLEK